MQVGVPRAAGSMVREAAAGRPLVAQFRSHAGPRAEGPPSKGGRSDAVASGSGSGSASGWELLTEKRSALDLELTLPGGQAFRWSRTGRPGEWAGVVHGHPVLLRHACGDGGGGGGGGDGAGAPSREAAGVEFMGVASTAAEAAGRMPLRTALEDYFALSTDLDALGARFSEADPRFADIFPYLRGSRILRQEPVEALMAFICSSNNNIARISGMVAHLAATYGDLVGTVLAPSASTPSPSMASGVVPQAGIALHAFPTAEQMLERGLNEEDLRRNGFGYRAKYVDKTVRQLAAKPGGSVAFLESLRAMPLDQVHAALLELDGVGPKVASCVCLFALDKPEAVPVDVHVLRLTVQHYLPGIDGKSLTPAVYEAIQAFYRDLFGKHAGWAQGILFAAELGMHRDRLPEHLRRALPSREPKAKAKVAKRKQGGAQGESEGMDDSACDGDAVARQKVGASAPPQAKPRRRIRVS